MAREFRFSSGPQQVSAPVMIIGSLSSYFTIIGFRFNAMTLIFIY